MVDRWLGTTWSEVWLVAVSALAMLAAVIAVVRVVGLRSLSKMSSFDFVVTLALGSIVATMATTDARLPNGMLAVAVLLGAQWVIARLRHRGLVAGVVDNQPLLLMHDGRFLDDNLASARVTRSDVRAKLRQANVARLDRVRAVVLETTGDVSVLHGDEPVDEGVLDDVRRSVR